MGEVTPTVSTLVRYLSVYDEQVLLITSLKNRMLRQQSVLHVFVMSWTAPSTCANIACAKHKNAFGIGCMHGVMF